MRAAPPLTPPAPFHAEEIEAELARVIDQVGEGMLTSAAAKGKVREIADRLSRWEQPVRDGEPFDKVATARMTRPHA